MDDGGQRTRTDAPTSRASASNSILAAMFDFDGILVDSEGEGAIAFREVIHSMGGELSEDLATAICNGKSWFDAFAAAAASDPQLVGRDEEFAIKLQQRIDRTGGYLGHPIESSIAALKRISRQMPVGVVSGSFRTNLHAALSRLGLMSHVATIVGAGDYQRGKPHPEPYLLAATNLGVAPEHCLAFEDSEAGIQSAISAGMRCIVLQSGEEMITSCLTVSSLDTSEVYDSLFATSASRRPHTSQRSASA